MSKNKPRFYYASDYAGLEFKNGNFYYGYERIDEKQDWCFVANIGEKEIVIPFSKLGASEMFNVVDCLMIGIGWILAKYELVNISGL